MKEYISKVIARIKNAPAWKRKTAGVFFVLYGFIALITPITPGSWLLFIGLEILGIRILFLEKLKSKFKKQ